MPTPTWKGFDSAELKLVGLGIAGALAIGFILFNDISLFGSNSRGRSAGEPIAVITSIDNNVKYRPADLPVWDPATTEAKLYAKDQIFTDGRSNAVIKFKNDAELDIGENSLVT